jgi:hypothetical protein
MVKRICSLSLFLSAFDSPSIMCFVISGIRREKVSVSLSISVPFMVCSDTVGLLLFWEEGGHVCFEDGCDFLEPMCRGRLAYYLACPETAYRGIKLLPERCQGEPFQVQLSPKEISVDTSGGL